MEVRTYDLLTKMCSEFSGQFDGVEKDIKGLKNDVARVEIKLEHSIEPKIQTLFEDRNDIHKKLDSIEQKIDALTNRADKQDIQINVIKGGKPKANKG